MFYCQLSANCVVANARTHDTGGMSSMRRGGDMVAFFTVAGK